jgi:ribosomal protein L37AE/L43A
MSSPTGGAYETRMPIEEKPSRNEDEYFVKLDAQLMKERRARLDEERRNQERSAHHNKCPKCGCDLVEREHSHVKIDECAECGGMWLDKGELEMIEEMDKRSSGFVGSLFGFRR